MTTKMWRVVCEGGVTWDVEVHTSASGALYVSGSLAEGPARLAVARFAVGCEWPVVEIRGPGEMTTAEAVADEREACAEVCDALDAAANCTGAQAWECASAIRGRAAR